MKSSLDNTLAKIIKWANDRNIIKGSTAKDQFHKLIQEVGELSDNLCKGKPTIDDIGDCMVILAIIAAQEGYTLEECANHAYDDIKDRKGIMRDGVFIKESDLIEGEIK